MKLSTASVVFFGWIAFFGFLAAADPWPGILVRMSGEGLQCAADFAVALLDRRIDQGLRVPDQDGSFSPFLGSVDYFLTEIEVKKFSRDNLTVVINSGAGVTASVGKIEASVEGKFSYKYTLMYIPTWNSGSFSLTISDVSLSVQATVGLSTDGLPTANVLSCSASVGTIDLTYQANTANWLLNQFAGIVKGKVQSTLTDATCNAIKNGRNLIEREVAKYTKPCIDSKCTFLVDLRLVYAPVFAENFIEIALRGGIFSENDTSLAPFEAPPFQPLPLSSKMVDLYVNVYVFNTLMYAMHQNHLLSYNFTRNDLSDKCRNVLDTSCENKSLCIGNILPEVFIPYSNATVELDFVAISAPFLNISHTSFSITFDVRAKVQVIRKPDDPILTVSVLTLRGSVAGSLFTKEDGMIEFNVSDIIFVNASISDKGIETDLLKSKDVVGRLQVVAKECLFPKFSEFGQRSLSKTNIGGFHAINRSITLIRNAFVFTSDEYYSKDT